MPEVQLRAARVKWWVGWRHGMGGDSVESKIEGLKAAREISEHGG